MARLSTTPLVRVPSEQLLRENAEETPAQEVEVPKETGSAAYSELLATNGSFRLYLSSMLVREAGGWFTYVAYVRIIESLYPENYTAVSLLVILRLIPKLIFSGFGGALADARDRRVNMIVLDFMGAAVVLTFLLLLRFQSMVLLFVFVFLQESITALYEPSCEAILPMLVDDEKFLEKAAAINEVGAAVVVAMGASLGGACVVLMGLQMCFLLDGAAYILSALFMTQLRGKWSAAEGNTCVEKSEENSEGCITDQNRIEYGHIMMEGMKYIWSSSVRPFVFLKSSAMLIYGATEVLAVSFSDRPGDPDGSSLRLGIIYGFYGVGCIVGPFVGNYFTEMENPRTLQLACVISFAVMALSFGGMASSVPFAGICLFMAVASCGAEILWLDSDLLLMKFSKNEFLGRVFAFDKAFALLCEGASAVLAGVLQDKGQLSAREVSWVMSVLGSFLAFGWSLFQKCGEGAPREFKMADGQEPMGSLASEPQFIGTREHNLTEESPLIR